MGCPSCPTKGDCSTWEVILELDGDAIKKECDFLGGKYKKITKLYDGKCIWVQIADPKAILRYNDFENAWVFGYDKNYLDMLFECPRYLFYAHYIRTVQDVPCPTVVNIFEYNRQVTTGDRNWKPAPINSVIIKCA